MRTDPTDNGGLFIGRRPGTAPVRYRVAPVRALGLRLTFDKVFASSAGIGLTLFLLWFVLLAGSRPEMVGGRR